MEEDQEGPPVIPNTMVPSVFKTHGIYLYFIYDRVVFFFKFEQKNNNPNDQDNLLMAVVNW